MFCLWFVETFPTGSIVLSYIWTGLGVISIPTGCTPPSGLDNPELLVPMDAVLLATRSEVLVLPPPTGRAEEMLIGDVD